MKKNMLKKMAATAIALSIATCIFTQPEVLAQSKMKVVSGGSAQTIAIFAQANGTGSYEFKQTAYNSYKACVSGYGYGVVTVN